MALLKEIPHHKGNVDIKSSIAYVEQEPIVFSGTIKELITFGNKYEEDKFNRIIEATDLNTDIKLFYDGIKTQIGERGVNLSGGQKARISLARALYSESDIYLLDDPVSAVDARVGERIFKKAIKYLLRDKTVLLNTHHLHFAKQCDNIILMNEGKILAEGNYEYLYSKYPQVFEQILKEVEEKQKENKEKQKEFLRKTTSIQFERKKKEKKIKKFYEGESHDEVSFKTYQKYIKACGGYCKLLIIFVFILIVMGFGQSFQVVLGYWTQQENNSYNDNVFYLKILSGIVIGFYILQVIRYYVMTKTLLHGPQKLHEQIIFKVIRAKKEFFDRNPSGRILNRFSSDIGHIDTTLIRTAQICIDFFTREVIMLLFISFISPVLIIGCVLIVFLFVRFGLYFKLPIQRIKQLESVSRSPVYSELSQTLSGLLIVRCYKKNKMFITNFMKKVNINQKINESFHWANRVLGVNLDMLSLIFAAVGIAILIFFEDLQSGWIGLGIMSLRNFQDATQYMVRRMLYFDQLIISVERIDVYCKLPEEPDLYFPNDKTLKKQGWPSEGRINFKEVYMRYNELNEDFVLKNISFNIKGGEKIGCVGRTGAGKSSLIQVLFRMTDPQKGSIFIDDVNIKDVGLEFLRRSIAIIPQTAFSFVGPIRYNLDPVGKQTDEELWDVLDQVGLTKKVKELKGELDHVIAFKQATFSVGQKQLLCLARAILRKAKIVVLDEATANVDFETDAFVQKQIKEKFADCTIFTVAHRLSTIIDYDRILVLDKGQVVEFDTPYNLLVNNVNDKTITKEGIFASLVNNTGKASANSLFEKAHECYLKTLQ